MHSIIKNTSVKDIKSINNDEINEALLNVNSDKQKIKELSDIVRKIIIGIIELSKSERIDLSSKNLKEEILESLNNSEEINKVGIGAIITKKIINKNNLEKLAYYDQNTGLPNYLKLNYDIEKINGDKIIILVKILGIDNLNKIYGYEGGNEIINEIIKLLRNKFESLGYKLYRESGITFGLVKENSNEDIESIELFIKKFTENFQIDTNKYGKMSINSMVGIDMGEKANLQNAIMALSNSEKNNEITIYSDTLKKELQRKATIKEEWIKNINEALEKGNIIPFFQGIRDNKTGEITKYESLVRMKKGDDIISPGLFLSHIQGTKLMNKLTKTMIIATVNEMKNNNNSFSVNLTETDLGNEEIINTIEKSLTDNNINPSRLTIEILEEIGTDDDNFINSIKKLKNIGLKIAIDDFGSGFSGFDRVYKVEPDYFKIDGSLIDGITNDDKKYIMLESIVDFAHKMGAKVIAERIEDQETQKLLEDIKIDYSQGYLFSKPAEKIEI